MYKNSFASFSFGCRVNEAEKIALDTGMVKAGFVQDNLDPDIYIINTCAVTAKAEREARQLILRLKKKNPKLKVVAMGCSATYWEKNNLHMNIPIDLLISTINKEFAVELIKKRLLKRVPFTPSHSEKTGISDKFLDSGRVMIKIQDGCHRFCSYCIVPYLRGLPRSRRIWEIVKQVQSYENNMREVILTAINTEAFGKDTGQTICQLVEALLQETAIERISFGSIHPWSITGEFLDYYRTLSRNPRFSNFFHIPLQSGSDKILRLMKRDYKREEIAQKLNALHKINPNALIATDVIVGFLEETDADFAQTYEFLDKSPISKFHIFRFSKRNNTAAYYMGKRLQEPLPQEKKKRAQALASLHMKKFTAFLARQINTKSKALFIGEVENGYQKAVLNNQLPVWIKTKDTLSGHMKHVTITELKKNELFGKIIG